MSVPPATSITRVCPICDRSYPYNEEHPCLPAGGPGNQAGAHAADDHGDELCGTIVGERYLIEACLRGGGMGIVYRARHVILGRSLAVKVLRVAADEAAQKRFLQEARLASELAHENIVDISDFGVLSDGRPYLVMELLRGETLAEVIARGPLPPLRACLLAAQIAHGLQAVHKSGIVHRDLKPDNVFVLTREGDQDFVKIVDFGIAKDFRGPALTAAGAQPVADRLDPAAGPDRVAKLTEVGMVVGTAEYMAPEQAMAKELDHRVDQYALGCILYEMLTGTQPFSGDPRTLLEKHVFEAPIPPRERRPDLGLPASLEALVLRAMAKKRGERFSTMKDMEQALRLEAAALADRTERPAAPASAAPTRPALPVQRRRRWPGMLGVIAGLSVAGLYLLLSALLPRPPPPRHLPLPPSFTAVPPSVPPLPVVRVVPAVPAAEGPPPQAPRPLIRARKLPAAPVEKDGPAPLQVRFEVRNRDVGVVIACTDRPPLACEGTCTVEIGDGTGECMARAPGSGYRPQRFPFSDLRGRRRDGQGRVNQPVNLDFISP